VFEFAGECIYWESVCYYLYQSSFVFCSCVGGLDVFPDVLSTAGFSYEEIGGFGGCGWVCVSVFFGGGGGGGLLGSLEDVLEPFCWVFP
jgi:hypothetical protein